MITEKIGTWANKTGVSADFQVVQKTLLEVRKPREKLVEQHHIEGPVIRTNFLLAQKSRHQSTCKFKL